MATWEMPVHESVNDDEEDAFEDNLQEFTFPPLRYLPLFYDRKAVSTSNSRRESAKERDRLYKELVGHEPYISHHKEHNVINNGGFYVKLDVRHYKPEEVTVKVEGHTLEVKGKHYSDKENGFESCEFYRKYEIPSNINPHSLVSKISQDGVLCIQVCKDKDPIHLLEKDETHNKGFKYSLDVEGYKPDEITIRVDGQKLFIHGESKAEGNSEHGVHSHQKQFTRQVSLPIGFDPAQLSSRYTSDFKLTVEAPQLTK